MGIQRALRIVFLPETRFQVDTANLHGHPGSFLKMGGN
jgi:hypothetical protein